MNEEFLYPPQVLARNRPVQLGFVPDADCAPVVVAQESGLFSKYELRVELRRETRWAGIRDRLVHEELDAAHAPATLPFIINLGVNSDRCACVAGMVLSLEGNAITISNELWQDGVRTAADLRERIYRHWRRRTFTFGVVFPHSLPALLLRQWLKAGNVVPGRDVRLVVIPPAQMFPTLKLGYIDGFCAGEPWPALAVEAGIGHNLATSSRLAPLHPEKVLLARSDFVRERASEHDRLVAALLEACAFCDQPKYAGILADMLSQPRYVNAPAGCFRFDSDPAQPWGCEDPGSVRARNVFFRNGACEPSNSRAAWVIDMLYEVMNETNLVSPGIRRAPMLKNVFRPDLFERGKSVFLREARTLQAEAGDYQASSS